MRFFPSKMTTREGLLIFLPAALLTVSAFWIAAQYIKPAPPDEITIATGDKSGAYYRFAERYAAELAKSGITVHIKATAGSVENIALLTAIESKVNLALVQGGVSNRQEAPNLVSLGRVFMEPVWVFYRAAGRIDRLSTLQNKRIAIGPEGSGTRQLALSILRPSGVTAETATFVDHGGMDAAACLSAGDCDAAFFVASPNAGAVDALLRDASVRLMNFRQAEALTRVLPFLSRVTLPEGVIDLVRNIPAVDTTLVAAQAGLIARSDIHPAIVGLLVSAAKRIHRQGGLFQSIGEFPSAADPEFPLSDAAEIAYNSGVPLLQRVLPFWLAIFVERMLILIVPIATILFPVMKLGPYLYEWRVRRRLLYWYGELKDLEHRIAADANLAGLPQHRADIEEINKAVSVIPVPLHFSDRFYELRAAVDLVQHRLAKIG